MLADILGPDGLILIAALIIVLLFGGSKLPKLARGLGSASHEFRKGVAEGDSRAVPLVEAGPEGLSSVPAERDS
jgi:sec-independent protein translocase protein TatA